MITVKQNAVALDPIQEAVKEARRFTGNEDHNISLMDASRFTSTYRKTNPGKVKGGFFGRKAIEQILNQPGVVGIRYYYGIDDNSKYVLVLCGVDAEGNDLVYGVLAERGYPCPPFCATGDRLNSDVIPNTDMK